MFTRRRPKKKNFRKKNKESLKIKTWFESRPPPLLTPPSRWCCYQLARGFLRTERESQPTCLIDAKHRPALLVFLLWTHGRRRPSPVEGQRRRRRMMMNRCGTRWNLFPSLDREGFHGPLRTGSWIQKEGANARAGITRKIRSFVSFERESLFD